MDEIQKKLVTMIKEQPSCINDRKQLKAILLDYLPQNKLQQNLILNAYDEDIVERLKPSSDVTLHALQMVKILSDGYGLTKDAAMWATITWCLMMKKDEVAEIIESMIPTNINPAPTTAPISNPQSGGSVYRQEIGLGTYAAGYDIPAGLIAVKPNQKIKSGRIRVWIIDGKKENIFAEIKDSFTIELKKGQLLKIEVVYSNSLNWPDYTFSVVQYN